MNFIFLRAFAHDFAAPLFGAAAGVAMATQSFVAMAIYAVAIVIHVVANIVAAPREDDRDYVPIIFHFAFATTMVANLIVVMAIWLPPEQAVLGGALAFAAALVITASYAVELRHRYD